MGIRKVKIVIVQKQKDFKEYLFETLQNPQEARAYLNAALLDDDQRVFLLALKDVFDLELAIQSYKK